MRMILIILAALILILSIGGLILRNRLLSSLPVLDGEITAAGLSAPVSIDRDRLGVPTLRGESHLDVIQALGFLHAQDRFFQMDMFRRGAAGELADLLGEPLVETDSLNRRHRFRALARKALEKAPKTEKAIYEAYARGVNQGLRTLDAKPVEYLLLRADPAPWLPEDSALVAFAMFLSLQSGFGGYESSHGVLFDTVPKPLAQFLSPAGTRWDAPLKDEPIALSSIPGPEIYDLRKRPSGASLDRERLGAEPASKGIYGSNSWAVAPLHTEDQRALLANDMHLDVTIPNYWYRAYMIWPDADGLGTGRQLIGLTLPGTPAVIVGSNTKVAWGLTVSRIDGSDLVELEPVPENQDAYLTPQGPRPFERFTETIRVKGGESRTIEILWTMWGPVIDEDHQGRKRAYRWIAHDPGVDLNIMKLAEANTLEEAMTIANMCNAPTQNFIAVDASGHIGWTILGRVPKRIGFDGLAPTSWADGSRNWDGWLRPEEVPRVINPPSGRVWSANNRTVGGEDLKKLGHSGYEIGSRATQIRDTLMALDKATVADMLKLQLDDRALFFERWRTLLLETLTPDAVAGRPLRGEFRELVEKDWSGKASVDSVGFRLVRSFRVFTFDRVYNMLTQPCLQADDRFSIHDLTQYEYPLWRLVNERPVHLLDARLRNWDELLLEVIDQLIEVFTADGEPLRQNTWGEFNMVHIQHPLSKAAPRLGRWLDVPAQPLPGSAYTPRYQDRGFGASMRMVVSPGYEAEGLFHMPCGQSGHPLSRFYQAGHGDWEQGKPTPLLPGETEHRLVLKPQ